jgi:ketopantoate reductase
MRTLIVGVGALGGLVAARLRAAGSPVWLATRDAESAARLKASGLRVTAWGARCRSRWRRSPPWTSTAQATRST